MFKEEYMRIALEEAKLAYKKGEIPVGCILVNQGQILARDHNRRRELKRVSGHAEILALEGAAHTNGDYRLEGTRMYVTLEPCIMCLGAILDSRVGSIYIGCRDLKKGAISSFSRVKDMVGYGTLRYEFGIMEKECSELIKSFFEEARRKNEF